MLKDIFAQLNQKNELKYLILGTLCFVALMILSLAFSNSDQILRGYLIKIFLGGYFVFNLLFFNRNAEGKRIIDFEDHFWKIISFGLISLFISVLPDIVSFISFSNSIISDQLILLFDLLAFYVTIVFLMFTLVMFKRLIYVKVTSAAVNQWRSLMIVLILSSLCILMTDKYLNFASYLLLFTGSVAFVSLVSRVKWIAIINQRTKYLCILYLVIVLLLTAGLLQKVYSLYLPEILHSNMLLNTFVLLLFIGVFSYGSLSLLALIFNLPVASVMEERTEEVKSFQELNQLVLRNEPIKKILEFLFKTCFSNSDADAGWFSIVSEEKEEEIIHTSDLNQALVQRLQNDFQLKLDGKDYFYKTGKFFSVDNIDLNQTALGFDVRDDKMKYGTIVLLRNIYNGFDDYTIQLMQSYIDQTKPAFQNQKLMKEAIENERYKEEMEIAKRVQMDLVPSQFPDFDALDIAAFIQPASEVGGDYYDIFVDDTKEIVHIISADVSGSGISAAFHMAELKGIFHSLVHTTQSMEEYVALMNDSISSCLNIGTFITLIYVRIDLQNLNMKYYRAGHTPLLIKRLNANSEFVEDTGLGMGILYGEAYRNFISINEITLRKSDVLVFYTDGIIEGYSTNKNEAFGLEGLQNALEESDTSDAQKILTHIMDKYLSFVGNDSESDDISLLVIKVKDDSSK